MLIQKETKMIDFFNHKQDLVIYFCTFTTLGKKLTILSKRLNFLQSFQPPPLPFLFGFPNIMPKIN